MWGCPTAMQGVLPRKETTRWAPYKTTMLPLNTTSSKIHRLHNDPDPHPPRHLLPLPQRCQIQPAVVMAVQVNVALSIQNHALTNHAFLSSPKAGAGHSSLARTIRNRVTQFASTFFIGNVNSQAGIHIVDRDNSIRSTNSSSGRSSNASRPSSIQQESPHPPLLPLVFPNLNLGTTSTASPAAREFIEEEPPSIVSITSRLVEGRLQTERTQPQLRLSAPTPNPTAFNHLPRDAIRLEKF